MCRILGEIGKHFVCGSIRDRTVTGPESVGEAMRATEDGRAAYIVGISSVLCTRIPTSVITQINLTSTAGCNTLRVEPDSNTCLDIQLLGNVESVLQVRILKTNVNIAWDQERRISRLDADYSVAYCKRQRC